MTLRNMLVSAIVLGAGLPAGGTNHAKADDTTVYELRTYTAAPGKMADLQKRFRDHTMQIFEKHGMKNVGYWVSVKQPDTLIYILAHKSRAAADKSWAEFRADPEWKRVRDESQKDGSLTTKVVSVYMTPTDFSPLK
ncbi:MAG TPA: NIPSNAP family protein [Planctomycetaceae bacterium]|nr:NIPSNAP family protein [Planctomycetaceae bacterium]